MLKQIVDGDRYFLTAETGQYFPAARGLVQQSMCGVALPCISPVQIVLQLTKSGLHAATAGLLDHSAAGIGK